MKCLKEVDNENIVKDVLETNEISGEMDLQYLLTTQSLQMNALRLLSVPTSWTIW